MKVKKFPISNLKNSGDISTVRESISKIYGVKAVRVDTVSNTITVDYDDNIVSLNELESKIQNISNNLTNNNLR